MFQMHQDVAQIVRPVLLQVDRQHMGYADDETTDHAARTTPLNDVQPKCQNAQIVSLCLPIQNGAGRS
jgi:hypothetical protein